MPSFADNLKTFPSITHLAGLDLFDAHGTQQASLRNQQGQAGSLALYLHLYQQFGAITPEAAALGLDLFAEHTAHAKANPNAHPNIDRLLTLVATGKTLQVKLIPA